MSPLSAGRDYQYAYGMTIILRLLNVVLIGLTAGCITGISVGYNPASFSYQTYLEYQQNAISSLNTLMPLVGMISILLTVIFAFDQRANKPVFVTLIVAIAFLIIAGLVTKFGNQPINSEIKNWNPQNPPINWEELRENWWKYHIARTLTTIVAFFLVVWASLQGRNISGNSEGPKDTKKER